MHSFAQQRGDQEVLSLDFLVYRAVERFCNARFGGFCHGRAGSMLRVVYCARREALVEMKREKEAA
jgi:hypothetical protein